MINFVNADSITKDNVVEKTEEVEQMLLDSKEILHGELDKIESPELQEEVKKLRDRVDGNFEQYNQNLDAIKEVLKKQKSRKSKYSLY